MVANMSRRSQFIAWVTAFGLFALGAAAAVALGRPAQIPAGSGRQVVESRGRLRQFLTERYEVRKKIAEYVQQSFNIGDSQARLACLFRLASAHKSCSIRIDSRMTTSAASGAKGLVLTS